MLPRRLEGLQQFLGLGLDVWGAHPPILEDRGESRHTPSRHPELDVPLVFLDRGQVPAVDSTWLRGAELMIMPAVSVGGYPIVAELEDVHIELDESALR